MRVPWVSVALLIVLGLLAAVAAQLWDGGTASETFAKVLVIAGWVGVGGSLLVGALGLWARAPATLATALGIVGAGAFAGAWLANMEPGALLDAVVVLAFIGVLVGFAASARRPA